MSLRARAISGVKWAGGAQILRNILAIIAMVILARLLSPVDFGLMGMAVVVIAFLELSGELGIGAAIIQRPNLSNELLSSAFWFNAGLGVLLSLLLIGAAPYFATFFREERLAAILSVLAIALLASRLGAVQRALLERQLRFAELATIDISATFFGATVGIVSAYLGRGVWSLVFQTITIAVTTTGLYWTFSSWRPAFAFSRSQVSSIMGFSLNLTGANIFNYCARSADNIIIGRYLGAQDLGYYSLAYQIMLYPMQHVSRVIGRVLFPVMSQIQDDDERLRRACLWVVPGLAIITLPMMAGLWAIATPFVQVVFGPDWGPVAILLLIMAPVGAIQSVGVTGLFQTKGRTDLQFRWAFFASSVAITSFLIGVQWGIYGVATAYFATTSLLLYPGWRLNYGLIDLPVREVVATLVRPGTAACTMVLIVVGVGAVMPSSWSDKWTLVIQVAIGMLSYAALIFWLEPTRSRELLAALLGRGDRGAAKAE